MQQENLKQKLVEIRDYIYLLYESTASMQDSVDSEKFDDLLEVRNKLTESIAHERNQMAQSCMHWESEARVNRVMSPILKDIEQMAESVRMLDRRISEQLSGEMDLIRSELKGLYTTSRAATAYSAHAAS